MIQLADRSKLVLFGEETERLTFRKLREDDFETWLSFCEDRDIMQYFAFQETDSAAVICRKWFDKIYWRYENQLGGMNVLIEKSSGEFIGQCGLLIQTVDEQEELEIGYSLMPQARGSGYALEAAKKCRDLAFQNDFSDSIISIIHPDNFASQQVAIKNGMQLLKQTSFHGLPVNVYRILKTEWETRYENHQ